MTNDYISVTEGWCLCCLNQLHLMKILICMPSNTSPQKKMSNCISGILFGVLRLQEEISQLQGKLDNSSALSEAHLGAHTRAENQVPTSGLEVLRVGEILQKSQPRKTSYKW